MIPGRSAYIQAIADARLRQDVQGMHGICLEPLAEVPDRDPQIFDTIGTTRAPYCTENLSMGENLAGILGENTQDFITVGRKAYNAPMQADAAVQKVDFKAVAHDQGGLSLVECSSA